MADGACVCWGVVWFLVLWFIGWPIAGFCAGFYILLLPLTVCIEGLKGLTDFLLKGLQLPYFCADHMMKGTPVGDAMK